MRNQFIGSRLVARSKLACCLIAVTFVLLSVSSVYADIVDVNGKADSLYHGSRNSGEGGGIDATGPWAGPEFVLSWHITEDNGTFTYVYGITDSSGGDLAKAVGNWILQLTPDDIDWTGIFDGVAGLGGSPEVGLFTQGPSTPGLPGDLFGVKFEFLDGTLMIQFETPYAPAWGSFWANGGKHRGQNVYASNTGFYGGALTPPGDTTDFTNWIPVDGVMTPVPEPSTLILLLSGTGLLAGAARFKKKI